MSLASVINSTLGNIGTSSSESKGYSQSSSSGGSIGSSGSANSATSNAYSNTFGTAASNYSDYQAAIANASAMQAWKAAAEYNSQEAQKNREWQERLANTQYQRSVADLKAAGLNPILAATNGISGASIGSGATASMGTPSSFMGSSFADQNSASTSYSSGQSWGSNSSWEESSSKSKNTGWSNSKWGMANFIDAVKNYTEGVTEQVTSAEFTQESLQEMQAFLDDQFKSKLPWGGVVGPILEGLGNLVW